MGVKQKRQSALERASAFSPFLRAASAAFPAIAESFAMQGAQEAVRIALEMPGDSIAAELRRRRTALALAVALGDLAGELALEEVTRTLSDFAAEAIDRSLAAAIGERLPEASTAGFAVLATFTTVAKAGPWVMNQPAYSNVLLTDFAWALGLTHPPFGLAVNPGYKYSFVMSPTDVQAVAARFRPAT